MLPQICGFQFLLQIFLPVRTALPCENNTDAVQLSHASHAAYGRCLEFLQKETSSVAGKKDYGLAGSTLYYEDDAVYLCRDNQNL